MVSFLVIGVLFLPMVLVIMGFPLNLVIMAAAAGATAELGRHGLLPRLARSWPVYVGTVGWIVLNLYTGIPSEENLFNTRYAFFSLTYGIPAGYLIHQYQRSGGDRWALFGYICVSIGLVLAVLYIIRVGSVTISVDSDSGVTNRSAENNNVINYLRFFEIGNVMMSSISFTIFGFSLPVLAFMRVRWHSLALGLATYGACLLVLQKLLTRTAFVAGSLASVIVFILVMRKEGGHLNRRRRLLVIGVLAAATFIGGTVLLNVPEFAILMARIRESGEDSRHVLWREAWDNILNKPWGGGTNGMITGGWAHSMILDFALYNGFLGMFLMLLVFGVAWYRCWRLSQDRDAMDNALAVTMVTTLIAITIAEMITPPFFGLILFVYIFIGYSGAWLDARKRLAPKAL